MQTCHFVSVKGDDVLKIGLAFFVVGAIFKTIHEQDKRVSHVRRTSQATNHIYEQGVKGPSHKGVSGQRQKIEELDVCKEYHKDCLDGIVNCGIMFAPVVISSF